MPVRPSGREAGALFEEDADFVVPVDFVEGSCDEAEVFAVGGVERFADGFFLRGADAFGFAEEAGLQARDAVGHGVGAEILRGEQHGGGAAVVALAVAGNMKLRSHAKTISASVPAKHEPGSTMATSEREVTSTRFKTRFQ